MAMLEIHDRLGQVRRVSISRDQAVLFGSSPQCDIVLDDSGALPIQGRIRWKRTRFKVDASPEAGFVVLNGRKMTSASFRQGDEIEVGSCRIFLLNTDEVPGQAPDTGTGMDADEEPDFEEPARDIKESAYELIDPRDKGTRTREYEEHARIFESPEFLEDLERPVVDEPRNVAAEPLPRLRRHRTEEQGETAPPVPAPGAEPAARAGPAAIAAVSRRVATGWGGLIRSLKAQDAPPGQERILSSPLVAGLTIALVFLLLMSYVLWGVIQRTVASRLYNQAGDSLNEGDYRTAILRYDEFLARFPGDERESKAKVLRALANVRQFTSITGASWTDALEAERTMVKTVSGEPAYRDSKTELAELVLRTAEALADRARGLADPRALALAESAVPLHARVAGAAAEAFLARSRVPARLAEARAAVRKAAIRTQALAAMDAALRARSAAGVYAARDALILQYADLAEDPGLIERMKHANELIRRAVTVDTSGRPAETSVPADPLGPPTSLVLRSTPGSASASTSASASAGEARVVHALAEGYVYGIDAATGGPLWQAPVGLSSPFPPQSIPGAGALIVFDARFDELVRLDARSGALVWRQAIGEPVRAAPLMLGNQVIQPTPAGKLLVLDLASGALRATADLGMPLTQTPVSDEAGQFLYLLADKDCLFVLGRDPLSCLAVEYLGHAAGSVAAPPARLGRYLVVAENTTLHDSRWRVYLIDQDGTKLKAVQQVAVAGWTWSTPASAGSVVWATGDRGSVAAFGIGGYDEKSPFRLIARTEPELQESGPAFALARSERELLLASGRSARLDLDVERGKLATVWTQIEAGPALAPPQTAADLLVLTQQTTEAPGVGLWAVDPRSGAVRWRTILGSGWPAAPALSSSAQGDVLTALATDGRTLVLSAERLARGGFVEAALPRPGGTRLPRGRLQRLASPGGGNRPIVLVPEGPADHLLVHVNPESDDVRKLALPGPLGAAPLFWNNALLVPGNDGRVDLIDPETGVTRAEPYLTPFDRVNPTVWCAPVLLGGEADADAVALADRSGRVRRLTLEPGPPVRLMVSSEVSLGSPLVADPIATRDALILVTADSKIRALASRDLSPAGAWPLPAALAAPPVVVGGQGFLADDAGTVHAFGPDGQRLWSIELRDGPASGPPALLGDAVWFLSRTGVLQCHALADGAPRDQIDLGIVPAGDLAVVGSQLVVPTGLGTLRAFKSEP
jgi:outer membrane protein assembly factor BamB